MHIELARRARSTPPRRGVALGAILLILTTAIPAAAQQGGRLEVRVVSASGAPVPGAVVRAEAVPSPETARRASRAGDAVRTPAERGRASHAAAPAPAALTATTDADGRAVIDAPAPGRYTVEASRIGYRDARRSVDVPAGGTARLTLSLTEEPIALDAIEVAVLRPDMSPTAELDERDVAEAVAHDAGMMLRTLPGLDAVRRGALGLDPVVRGLRETQVGVYVDGVHAFPGGPGGMDTPLSHTDPAAIRSVEVIKGPYALTWGAGNMSAIRVETLPLPGDGAAPFGARFFTGYDANPGAVETGAQAAGTLGRAAYALSGAWRRGDDYTAGDGSLVPASFRSAEGRAKLGLRLAPGSHLTLAGAYQAQRAIDYPGRPLDADYFDVYNGSVRWELARDAGPLAGIDALAYAYDVDHGMSNGAKPTALPDPDRMPPHPLAIDTRSGIRVYGGRFAALLRAGENRLEVGGDAFHAIHDARRVIDRRDTGAPMGRHLIWGGARITDAGLFLRAERAIGDVDVSAAIRLDRVLADADSASDFFRTYVTDDLSATETNLSAALTAGLPVARHWTLSAGIGSVVRTADANERFSDRNPARKMQIGAEFVGDPRIAPERSTQLDVWLEGRYPDVAVSLNVFGRRIDHHITIEPTELPRQSMMNAPTVYRYVNGEATYWGYEAAASVRLPRDLTLSAAAAYLYGQDETLDEPAFGVPPLRGDVRLRWEPGFRGAFLEGGWRGVATQDRVATSRGEVATEGYRLFDIQGGFDLARRTRVRMGIENLTDEAYVNHLNATNPFTRARIPEPGRVLFVRLEQRL